MHKYTNALVSESSPYLLQHAHNPVDWVSWNTDAFEKAKEQNKLVLVSVGYSACHWCHVMEHESFEDEEVAAIMNKYFICIKVDREERPDVDQVYMTAVQLMTQQGGWPLNCFTLPDGRPIYGGTYFPKEQWMQILLSLEQTYRKDLPKVLEYADKLHEGINQSELIDVKPEPSEFKPEKLQELVQRWSKTFDYLEGGPSRAPKFMLPNNMEFLLRYGHQFEDEKIMNYVKLTLDKMAMGGIYDQIGGGFSRYSVDMLWKVPHFEKMLYDNGQLLSLYSLAYQKFKSPLYKRIVYQTVDWLKREMLSKDHLFFSALDADSEGEEGRFYVWTKRELENALDTDYTFAAVYYDFSKRAVWEHNIIPLRTTDDKSLIQQLEMSEAEFEDNIAKINEKLREERNNRVRPGTDDKCLTSWNSMAISGLAQAAIVFNDEEFELLARKTMRSLLDKMMDENFSLKRNYKNGNAKINAFLEDYAHLIDALLQLYQLTFEKQWLEIAQGLMEYTKKHFQHPESKLFYFTEDKTELISRKMELQDNVLPASNSMMANNLFQLDQLLRREDYIEDSKIMLTNMLDGMERYGSGYSNWATLLMNFTNPFYEIKIRGTNYLSVLQELNQHYLPNKIVSAGKDVILPEGVDPDENGETMIYICTDGKCLLPSGDIGEILREIKN